MNRRHFLKAGVIAGLGFTDASANRSYHPTPAEVKGPFYPLAGQKDKDFDLTRIGDTNKTASGQHITVIGCVLNANGEPVEEAMVDIWQANAAGKYAHSFDSNPAPVDSNFQGWAIVSSGKRGEFKFKTVYPGAYPASHNWTRPPHIHFKIFKQGYKELITQMYFPNHPLNDIDRLLQAKTLEQQQLMIAEKSIGLPHTYHYQVVIQKA
ncbi:MAG: protocatechuate 3,4-dioxygenase [Pseudomonadota bacterium]